MSLFRSNVLAARERLAEGHADFQKRHNSGCGGAALCGMASDLRDAVLLDLFEAALRDLDEDDAGGLHAQVALVAHGGYGRRDVAPYSDVDLMILHEPGVVDRVVPLAERLLRDVFDAGLILGHSVRTVEQACRLACADPRICTSLVESRLLAGDARLFERFRRRFRRCVGRRARPLVAAICRARLEERLRYGDSVYLIEPNVKRSPGALRDLQMIRWIGCVRYGTTDPRRLHRLGALSAEDVATIEQAGEFLLRLRNELHFHAALPADVLSRPEQVRIAGVLGYQPAEGMLPVERFMRDYFRHTAGVSHAGERFACGAQSRDRLARLVTAVFGRRVDRGVRVGPAGVVATRQGLRRIRRDLGAVARLVDLANLHDAPIASATWEAIRREAPRMPQGVSAEAARHFLSLLDHPTRLGPLLRNLHEAGLLERFIPEFAHARGLVQFNQYHKYTVDEHCLRAVECAAELAADPGLLGREYRAIRSKHVLHLALLIHDLGKGFLEDHREVGLKIARAAVERLGLADGEAVALGFLVHRHMLMNHLAFRRDTSDEQLVVRFAVQVGSPEMLRMLLVLTAADLGAVGPGVWDGWKAQIVVDLYQRTLRHLADESPAATIEKLLRERREAVLAWLGPQKDDPFCRRLLDALPAGYLSTTIPKQAAADLRLLGALPPGGITAGAVYLPETHTVQFTVGTFEQVTPGIFHKLTGALSSHGLQIRSAQINTLIDGLVLDRFWVYDPDYAGPPPPERLKEVNRSLAASLEAPAESVPSFRRIWQVGSRHQVAFPTSQTRVLTDNTASARCTVLDIFAHDRTGLLYAVTRTLFELGLSVWHAKIDTYRDQVVDVFYVTDEAGRKIENPARLEEVRQRLVEVIESVEEP